MDIDDKMSQVTAVVSASSLYRGSQKYTGVGKGVIQKPRRCISDNEKTVDTVS